MRRHLTLYAFGVLALIAAGVVWAWPSSRPPPAPVAARAVTSRPAQRARPLPLAPLPEPPTREHDTEAETELEPPAEALEPDESLEPAAPRAPPTAPAPEEATHEELAATERPATLDAPILPEDTPVAPAHPAAGPARPREVSLVRLRLWSQPGMCADPGQALSARETLGARFRYWDGGERGQFHVDPRLPLDAVSPILDYLAEADREVTARLKLSVTRPETFVYFDKQLMTSVACISPDVAAYYDGALHVAGSDPDLRASVLHEYTHHALISSGLLGPAWAQEGIAMNIAHETWWFGPRWFSTLLEHPFGMDDLDSAIPYKLATDQALQFYAQSAALVLCVLETKHWELDALFKALQPRAGSSDETLVYELPELERPSFLRGCLERWSEQPR